MVNSETTSTSSVVTEKPSVVTEKPSVVTEKPSVVTEKPSVVTKKNTPKKYKVFTLIVRSVNDIQDDLYTVNKIRLIEVISEDAVTESKEVVTESEEVVTKSEEVTTKSEEVTTKSEDSGETGERARYVTLRSVTPGETGETGECDTESKEVVTESEEVTTESEEVVTESEEVVTESITESEEVVTTESEEVVTESEEVVTTESEEVVTESGEVTTKSEEVVIENIIPHDDDDNDEPSEFIITYKLTLTNAFRESALLKDLNEIKINIISLTGGKNNIREFEGFNRFCLTLRNDVTELETDKLENLIKSKFAVSIVYTHEMGTAVIKTDPVTKKKIKKGDGNTPHVQMYMVTYNRVMLLEVKRMINKCIGRDINPHVELARGTAWQNYKYITAELKEHPEFKHRMLGEPILKPGRSEDFNTRKEFTRAIEEGKITLNQIKECNLEHFVKNEQYYIRVVSIINERRPKPPPFICWFSGRAGTGKSWTGEYIANKLNMSLYNAGVVNGFWNDYNDEDLSLFNEYRNSGCTFATLLNVTDKYGTFIDVKYGRSFFKPYVQIYTSADGVASAKTNDMKLYRGNDMRFEQLLRRVHLNIDFVFPGIEDDCIPNQKDVAKLVPLVATRVLQTFKYHLQETGYSHLIDNYPVLKDLDPIPYTKLVNEAPEGNEGTFVIKEYL